MAALLSRPRPRARGAAGSGSSLSVAAGRLAGMEFYPYPPAASARIDPFDTKTAAVQYRVWGGSRSTYAFTGRVAPGPDFPMDGHIPMGYKVLQYAQKIAVCKDAELVREWPRVEEGPRRVHEPVPEPVPGVKRKTRPLPPLASIWEVNTCGFMVESPSGEVKLLGYDAGEAMEAGALASIDKGTAAVWFVYAAENWH
ncbi:hypothetical protein GCM10009853_045210 [Glycomyces scopariae]